MSVSDNTGLWRLEMELDRLSKINTFNDLLGYQRRRIRELEGQLAKMKPVVEAAVAWADSFTGTKAFDDLEAAVAKYTNKKPTPIPRDEPGNKNDPCYCDWCGR